MGKNVCREIIFVISICAENILEQQDFRRSFGAPKVCEEALENIEEAAETVSKRRRSCAVKIPVFKHQEVENIKAKEFLEI